MNKYMTYEDRLDRMMEYGEPEDDREYRELQRLARRIQREDDKKLADTERFNPNHWPLTINHIQPWKKY